MIKRFEHVLGHEIGNEMEIKRGPQLEKVYQDQEESKQLAHFRRFEEE